MGTRCDFYRLTKNNKLDWRGSLGWNGWCNEDQDELILAKQHVLASGTFVDSRVVIQKEQTPGVPVVWPVEHLIFSKTQNQFDKELMILLNSIPYATKEDHGWPWPWNSSDTTDFAYCFLPDQKVVGVAAWGVGWFTPDTLKIDVDATDYDPITWPTFETSKETVVPPWDIRSGLTVNRRPEPKDPMN